MKIRICRKASSSENGGSALADSAHMNGFVSIISKSKLESSIESSHLINGWCYMLDRR